MSLSEHTSGADGFFNRRTVAGGLLAVASVGAQTLAPLVWPSLDRTIGLVLISVCAVAMMLGIALLWTGRPRTGSRIPRRWKMLGTGQGWVEVGVRSDAGDNIIVSWNAGSDADQISIWVTFRRRHKPRRSDLSEVIFNIDGHVYEWDVPDTGDAGFTLELRTWRDLEAVKPMISAMRAGEVLRITAPALSLDAEFTLDGAFDALEGADTMGD